MSKTILVVDDEPDIMRVLMFRLKKAGFDVQIAGDGEEALEKARQLNPDLMLLDMRLPVLNGDEVCRQLKGDDTLKHIPVIFLTASSETMNEERVKALKGDDYIVKPFDFEDLMKRIDRVVG